MDAINSAAAFLLIRMKLNVSEQEMVHALLLIFGVSDRNHLMPSLLERLSKISKLRESYDSWKGPGKMEKLVPEDVYLVFSHAHVHHFSTVLNTTSDNVTTAMCELIPFLIRRYSTSKHSQNAKGA